MSTFWNGAHRHIQLREVGTRDGLQACAAFVATGDDARNATMMIAAKAADMIRGRVALAARPL